MVLNPSLRDPKEKPLFILGVIFSFAVWASVLYLTKGIALLYLPFVYFSVLFAQGVFIAYVKGNGVKVSREQLPELYGRVERAAEKLGLLAVPDVYVMQHGGLLNAFATKLLSRRFVVIYSDLLDSCQDARQADFIIGHELGHLAAGHLMWNAYLAPFRILPIVGMAYSRACEYTCDRCGHEVVGELEPSMRGLVVLAAGGKQTPHVNLDAFMRQSVEAGTFFMAIAELISTHPYLCKRVAALQRLTQTETVALPSRNPFAYPFAFFMGGTAFGGVSLVTLVIIGAVAAALIPTYSKLLGAGLGGPSPFKSSRAIESDYQKLLKELEKRDRGSVEDGIATGAEEDLDEEVTNKPATEEERRHTR